MRSRNPLRALPTVMSAFFGIRRRRNAEQDLSFSLPTVIIAAVLFIGMFITAIVIVVRVVIAQH